MRRPDLLRREFPVFENVAYLGAGSCGPLPASALRAGADAALAAAENGRGLTYFEETQRNAQTLRASYAIALGADPADVALTLSTGDGLVRALAALDLREGAEVLTADDEHPSLLGPLAQLRRVRGIRVRSAPLTQIASAVTETTTLVACSHVSWVDGTVVDPAIGEVGRAGVPVLLDGAQGAGSVQVDLAALGCCAYAGSGQKWMCGPVGTGMLWIAPGWRDRLPPAGPTITNLAEPNTGLDAAPWPDARGHDAAAFASQTLAAANAAAELLASHEWPAVWERGADLADALAARLRETGRTVAPRGRTTLVAWEDADPVATAARLADGGVVLRSLPNRPLLRASVGAWNDETDLERLLAAL